MALAFYQSIAVFSTKVSLLHVPYNTNKSSFFNIMLFIFHFGKQPAPTLSPLFGPRK